MVTMTMISVEAPLHMTRNFNNLRAVHASAKIIVIIVIPSFSRAKGLRAATLFGVPAP
jgi:hypothetical protein